MKRSLFIILIIGAAFSCSKVADSFVLVSASLAPSRTKASVGGETAGGYPVLWESGDRISLDGTLSDALNKGGGTEAFFAFHTLSAEPPYHFLYPGNALGQVTLDGSTVPMYASVSDLSETVRFSQLGCALRISLSGNLTLSSLRVEADGGESVAGIFSVNFASGTLTPVSALSSVEKSYGESLAMLSAKDFFIFLSPGTFSAGLSLTAKSVEGVRGKWHFASGKTLEKGRMYVLPELSFVSRDFSDGVTTHLEDLTEQKIDFEL